MRKDLRRNKREERGGEDSRPPPYVRMRARVRRREIFSPSRAHACASEERGGEGEKKKHVRKKEEGTEPRHERGRRDMGGRKKEERPQRCASPRSWGEREPKY